MSHMIEITKGKASFVYAGEPAWHGLGKNIPSDLTPHQVLEAANLDWEVNKVPAFIEMNGEKIYTGTDALVRSSDNSILDTVSSDWNPVQNAEAFGFFHDFVMAGNMEMHTAGSLDNGRIVWALAKVKDGFTVFGKDHVESHLLFTNPHKYGKAVDVRFTPIRVVCWNTLSWAIRQKAAMQVSVSHKNVFNGDAVKTTLGIAHNKLDQYKETAEFLGSVRFKDADATEYVRRLFPISNSGDKKKEELSANAKLIKGLIEKQPGAEFAEGSYWSLFNAVTFAADHVLGRSQETRLKSAWYGPLADTKLKALELAIDMADANR